MGIRHLFRRAESSNYARCFGINDLHDQQSQQSTSYSASSSTCFVHKSKRSRGHLPHLLRLQTRSASDAYANTRSHRRVSSDRSTQSGLRRALEGSYKELTDKSVT